MPGLDFLVMEVFAVDVDELRAAVGSQDKHLLSSALKRAKTKPWNEFNVAYAGKWVKPIPPSITHLVMKTPLPPGAEPRYVGHALRLLTSMHGTALSVSSWRSFGPGEFSAIDKALAKLGAKLELGKRMRSGAPVKLPEYRSTAKYLTVSATPIIGHVDADSVARTAPILAAAVDAGKSGSPAADRCEMKKAAGKKLHTWVGSVVGSDVVQVWRAPSGEEERTVSRFKAAELARANYESFINDRLAEGYEVASRTEAAAGRARAKVKPKAPVIPPTLLAYLEEASTWYAEAAKAKRGLMFFAY